MTTDRRTAANRANAAHSTGPRTAEGKAASSRNVVSHGITSTGRITIFNWESPEEHQQLRDDYCARFRPIDQVELDIVERMVDATWRRRRAITIETTIYDLEISEIEEEVREDFAETATGPLRLALAFKNTATATESGTPSSASSTPPTAATPALSAISKCCKRTASTRRRSSSLQRRTSRIPKKRNPQPPRRLRSPKSWK
jgi:hypothetical protein